MFKIHGNRNSKNLVVGWGSTKGAVLDAINGLDVKFLQIIYVEPFSSQIKKELQKAEKIILIENNSTSQLGDLIIQKTGIEIKDKILKYDGRPFFSDKLNEKIKEILNGS
jgi:2-oxoglutarate ferredoxin oxidoreductase subunit alpha